MKENTSKLSVIESWVYFAIREKRLIYVITALLIAIGIYGIIRMNKDEFPAFEIKQGLIVGIYPGATAAEVEEQLAKPLEKVLMSYREVERPKVKTFCIDGRCYILAELDIPPELKDLTWAKIKLGLQQAKLTLPAGVAAVAVLDNFSASSAMLIAMDSEDKSPIELGSYAEEFCDRLRQIPELSSATVTGHQEEEIAVILDREKLSTYGIDPTSILLSYQTSTIPVGAGTFESDYTSAPIYIKSPVADEYTIANRIIWSDPSGSVIRLKDIATIERRFHTPDSYIHYNNADCLIIDIGMRQGNDIVAFGSKVSKVMEEFKQTLPDSVNMNMVCNQPEVVGSSVWSFLRDLLISMIMVILVMLLLFRLDSALIASSGVPVCTAVGIAIMSVTGMELNTVTLAALIVCLGMIVDDSIITMDGFMDKLNKGMRGKRAAMASAKELFTPTLIATLAICLMFFPVQFIFTGYLGDFVGQFPWVILIALMTSLVYAMTVVPSLEVRFIKPTRNKRRAHELQEKFFELIQSIYDRAQDWCFAHPKTTITIGVGAILLGIGVFSQLNLQMLPKAGRNFFVAEITLESGNSMEKTREYSDSLTTMFLSDRRVESVTSFIGTSAPRFSATYVPLLPSPHTSQLIVRTKSKKATEEIIDDYESKREHIFPNAIIRYRQMDYQAVDAPIAIVLQGARREDMLEPAQKIRAFMETLGDDVKWVHTDADNIEPVVNIELDPDEAGRLGINKSIASLSLAGTFNGQKISDIWEDGNAIPVMLYSEGINRQMDYSTVENQIIASGIPGVTVPLRQVAKVSPEWTLAELNRRGGRESVTIYCDVRLGSSQPAAQKKIKQYIDNEIKPELDPSIEVKYEGLSMANSIVMPEIAWAFTAAVLILFFFLLLHFKKTSIAVLTMASSLLCLFGASLGLWLFKLDFTITAVLGLISLIGIIVRNGILLFEYAEEAHFVRGLSVLDAAVEAGKRRMRPIFLTSCTTALGVLPMVISGDALWMPMGVVICFGTLLSIILTVLFMPVAYWLSFKNSKAMRIEPHHVAPAIAIALMLGVPSVADAQQKTLTLSEAKEMALSNAASVKNAQLSLESAREQKKEVFLEYMPTVMSHLISFKTIDPLLDLNITDIIGKSDAAWNIRNSYETYANEHNLRTNYKTPTFGYAATLIAMQPIYAGGRIRNGNTLAGVGVRAAELQKDIELRDTKADIEKKYWLVVSLCEKQKTIADALATLDTLHRDASVAFENGLITSSARLMVEQKQAELKATRTKLLGGIKLAKMDLLNAIAYDYKVLELDNIQFIDRLDDFSEPQAYYMTAESMAETMEELELLSLQVQAKDLQKKMIVGETLPQVGLVGVAGYAKTLNDPTLNAGVAVSVRIPISDWGKASHKIRRYENDVQKARNDRDYLSEQLVLKARQLWVMLETAWEELQAAQEALAAASDTYSKMESQHQAGMIVISDLMQSRLALRQAEDACIDAQIAYRQALDDYLQSSKQHSR